MCSYRSTSRRGVVCLDTTPRQQAGIAAGVARSNVFELHVVGVQTVEELPDRPLGPEHVKGHMLPMLRDDLVFALRF